MKTAARQTVPALPPEGLPLAGLKDQMERRHIGVLTSDICPLTSEFLERR